MNIPKYIQLSASRCIYHHRVVRNNAVKIKNWMKANNIPKDTPVEFFVGEKKSKSKVAPGQSTIFDYL